MTRRPVNIILMAFLLLCPVYSMAQTPFFPSPNYTTYPNGNNGHTVRQQVNQQSIKMMGINSPVAPPSEPALRHQFIIGQYNQDRKQQQIQYVQAILSEDLRPMVSSNQAPYHAKAKPYYDAFDLISSMVKKDSFLLTRAVFLVENAWYDGELSYVAYQKKIKEHADWARLIMRQERLTPNNNLNINYAIQKLYSGKINKYGNGGEVIQSHKPFRYDFKDYRGDTNWTQMFVNKLLYKGTGQCHSMPLLYLLLAEHLGGEAFLSLAPEHSYIKFRDDLGNWFNFEATNGNLVSDDWLMSSGFVNAAAVKSRIFMDTLGVKELAAQILVDLVQGYRQKFGYDDFLWKAVGRILEICPNSIQAMMLKADMLLLFTKQELRKAKNPPIKDIVRYPKANEYYTALMSQYDAIDNLGYVAMPEELYQAWLRSLANEKRKVENEQIANTLLKNAKKSE